MLIIAPTVFYLEHENFNLQQLEKDVLAFSNF